MEFIRGFGINLIVLFGLVFIMTFPGVTFHFQRRRLQVFLGCVLGLMTIVIMMNAWSFADGAFYDARTVMISLITLFFPLPTAFLATTLAVIYRAWLGGIGVYAGTLSMVFAFLVGVLWKRHLESKVALRPSLKYLLFGVVVHLTSMLAQLTLPYPENLAATLRVWPVFLIVFPIATMILALALLDHYQRLADQKALSISEKRYRSLFDHAKLGIFQYNTQGVIESANDAFGLILNAPTQRLIGLEMLTLPNQGIVSALKKSLDGQKSSYEGPYQSVVSGHKFPVRVQFAPIIEEDQVMGGLGVVEDLTEEYKQKEALEKLRMYDRLTDTLNRSTFEAHLFEDTKYLLYPVTLIVFDLNTFQIINTTFGYDVGNDVLKYVANMLLKHAKAYETVSVYRTGGDEFSILCEGLDETDTSRLVENIKVSASTLHHEDIELKLSYGIAHHAKAKKDNLDLYAEALSQLQEHKVYEGSSVSKKTVDIVMSTLFEKSPREKEHSERVAQLAERLALSLNLDDTTVKRVTLAGRLHDIGKINISETILDKPGRLTEEEYDIIKKHPASGFKILSSVPEYLHIANIVYTHHERYDGLGYPHGLKGEDIPLEARIIALADAYDAMTELRTYRGVLSQTEALEEVLRCAGTQFDATLADVFVHMLKDH